MTSSNNPLSRVSRVDNALTVREMLKSMGVTATLEGDITEFAINKPGEHWTESAAGWQRFENSTLTLQALNGLANAAAIYCKKPLSRDNPIASLTLPDGERCQIVLPPATEDGRAVITIRKPSTSRFTLDDYEKSGRLKPRLTSITDALLPWEQEMLDLSQASQFKRFFEIAVEQKLNIVTVGGTGSGKTTFSKCLIDLYPFHRRMFTIEDARELTMPYHPNSVPLFFSPLIGAKEILASCMRMKPDHIFLAELRGDEAWDYLMALKSGHTGSVTSIHANDCRGALYKIGSYIKQSAVGQTLDFTYIMQEVMTTIDVVAYFDKTYISELYYDPMRKLKLLRGEISAL
ncbi:MAG: P-type DNA transfer ATPase VirB11 [Azoarcus sp.]|jgi:type IV secretion system protein VirB11|nr:P-type DNA transfer ATPase VirB11 [Azoarcus sp.]